MEGYFSEGRSIEVYVDLEIVGQSAEELAQELAVRTGANRSKFHICSNKET